MPVRPRKLSPRQAIDVAAVAYFKVTDAYKAVVN